MGNRQLAAEGALTERWVTHDNCARDGMKEEIVNRKKTYRNSRRDQVAFVQDENKMFVRPRI